MTNLSLNNATSTLNSSVSSLSLINNSVATTTAAGSVTGSVYADSGSTLNLGAALNLSGNLDIRNGSTLNMNGNAVSANEVLLGYYGSSAVTVQNQGTLAANYLYLGNGTSYHFLPSDSVGYLNLSSGSSATTAAIGNITGSAIRE